MALLADTNTAGALITCVFYICCLVGFWIFMHYRSSRGK